jgi:sucrose-6-phosphate hydrolase SacC (GH32 family)
MKWQKLGKIFDPAEHNLADGYSIFAKSPQALVFDEFVRIYFCVQKKTENGKYVSCPHYADFDKNLCHLRNVSSHPAIALGELGHFDEHGIFPMNVLRHENRIMAFTTGWSRRTSVSIDMEIGFAESFDDGATFTKPGLGGPVMSPTYNEPFLVGDGFVRFSNGAFHMWYIFGDKWRQATAAVEPDRYYRIAYAHSPDGVNWERDGRYIIETKSENECQALPTVFTAGGRYHMYFCYRDAFDFRQNREKAYRLGYACSVDGLNWTRCDEAAGIDVTPGSWDSDMMCYPHAFECDGNHYLLYNGNEFGKNGFGAAKLINL